MKPNPHLEDFSSRLGYRFTRPDLLEEALTHASLSAPGRSHNQRLEFLGDRVLGLVIADALLKSDSDASEGQLAPRLNALVRKETCAEVAGEIDIGAALMMGRSEMLSGGRRKMAILGDAMEAVIAAVFLDSGLDEARALILRLWGARLEEAETVTRDAKTALQEWAQARGEPPPSYDEISREGPDHAPVFTIRATLENGASALATASSKRAAQQAAAEELLDAIEAAE